MSNALQTLDFGSGELANVSAQKTDVKQYASAISFLRRVQLYGKDQRNGEEVLIQAGNWGIPMSKTEIKDLGKQIDIIPFAVRDKVLDTNPAVPVAVYDKTHDEYQRIMSEAVDEDGKVLKDTGIMFGPSFLVFERTTAQFYELFFGNASGREEGQRMAPFLPVFPADAERLGCDPSLPSPCTLKRKWVERGKYTWWAPVVTKCSLEFDSLPPMEDITKKIVDFTSAVIEGEEEEADDNERTR